MKPASLPHRIAATAREHRLFATGDTLVVALSGGADSCALLDILAHLPDLKPRLVVAHLNHCLRGSESDQDELFCRERAEHYALPFLSRRVEVLPLARSEKLSLEDAGRRARYAFLEEVAARHKAVAIALGHHADDQAETVMMRLLRGAGLTGLSGMSHHDGRGRIRPLLDVTRRQIEAYLSFRQLPFREDSSNRDTAYLRNRIRHELLPLLEQYNPAIRQGLNATAQLLSEEDTLLEGLTDEVLHSCCHPTKDGMECDQPQLAEQPAPLRRRVLRRLLLLVAGNLQHFSQAHLKTLDRLICAAGPHAQLHLPQGVRARRCYNRLFIEHEAVPPAVASQETVAIPGPGSYDLPWGFRLDVAELPLPQAEIDSTAMAPCFSPDLAPFPWQVRTFREGDRMRPLGMTGSKKVKNILIDAKIPLEQRRSIPLVFSQGALIWVCGVRAGQQARLEPGDSRCLKAVCERV